MLPSTGRFRGINCPFFNSGLCERPYCHFRHVRNESEECLSDQITTSATAAQSNDNIVQIVSETVRKLLPALHSDGPPTTDATSGPPEFPSLVSRVLEELKPESSNVPPQAVPSYKPTPIAELKKAHIPISYKATCLQPQYRTIEVKPNKAISYEFFTKSSKKKLEYTPFRPGIEDAVIPGLDLVSHEPDVSRKNQKKKLEYTPFRPGFECRPPVLNGSGTSFSEVGSYEPAYVDSVEDENVHLQNNAVNPEVSELEDDDSSEVGFSPESEEESNKIVEECHDFSEDEVDIELKNDNGSKIKDSPDAKVSDVVVNDEKHKLKGTHSGSSHDGVRDKHEKNVEKIKDVSNNTDSNSEEDNKLSKTSNSGSNDKAGSVGDCGDVKHQEKKKHSEGRTHSKSVHGHKHSKASKDHSEQERKHKRKHSKHSTEEKSEVKRKSYLKSKPDSKNKTEAKSKTDLSKTESRSKTASKSKADSKSKTESKSKTNSKSISKSHSSSRSKDSNRSRHSDSGSHSSSRHKSKHSKHSNDKHAVKNVSSSMKKPKSDKSKQVSDVEENNDGEIEILDRNDDSNSCIVIPDSTSESEESITDECLRIFEEYEPEEITVTHKKRVREVDDDDLIPSKKRVAHPGAKEASVARLPVPVPKRHVNPAQTLLDRFAKVRDALCEASEMGKVENTSTGLKCANTGGRVRIAPVSNVISLMAKPKAPFRSVVANRLNSVRGSCDSAESSGTTEDIAEVEQGESSSGTVAQTVVKGSRRVAHVPSQELIFQPSVKDGTLSGVVPLVTRQKYLTCLFDEFKKHISLKDACEKAASEEHAVFSKCTVRTLYFNRMAALIQRIRQEAKGQSSVMSNHNHLISHADILAGKTKGSWSVKKTNRHSENEVKKCMYEILSKYILTDEELKTNGFPRPHSTEKGVATVQPMRKPATCSEPRERICCRCNTRYQVNKHGLAVRDEHCTYHPGRRIKLKLNGMWDTRYACCKTEDSVGCCTASCHVSDGYDPDHLKGFVHTLPKEEEPPDGDFGVFALDCEMVYTTDGLELARVTVINSELNTVYETLVKPENVVLDCNTRYSGIEPSDLENVRTSIFDVQAVLLGLFNDKTILIGHSLDSDLKALKIIHDTVVDTSVLFPHRLGPPYKRSLKNLAQDILRKVIQEDVGGHDSAEDAIAAMELARWRVQEDLRAS